MEERRTPSRQCPRPFRRQILLSQHIVQHEAVIAHHLAVALAIGEARGHRVAGAINDADMGGAARGGGVARGLGELAREHAVFEHPPEPVAMGGARRVGGAHGRDQRRAVRRPAAVSPGGE